MEEKIKKLARECAEAAMREGLTMDTPGDRDMIVMGDYEALKALLGDVPTAAQEDIFRGAFWACIPSGNEFTGPRD